ncbi:MAG: citramalate synthase [Spirochaetaceae bacterium]|jgi:2-isopropylmalate synthase|nr:citramalate synthase [Spirochaetaceae bacterium]
MNIEILDTTLRDGAQGEGISFSVQDKLAIVRALDELGIPWIEAGNPGSNPKDAEFFSQAARLKPERARLCAFGATRRPNIKCADDPQLRSLLEAGTEGISIFGKSWDLHVKEVLRVSEEENLAMIAETIEYLKAEGRIVLFDAEHFFDGWRANPGYALSTLQTALRAGADRIVLCDTNGASFPGEISAGVAAAIAALGVTEKAPLLGIHAHNDTGLAIAASIAAVEAGCTHIQGTLAGFGERCGNTCLAALIPSLELKLGCVCLPEGKLERISELTRLVAEVSNVPLPASMPYVGSSAFSHKGGMHSDGVLKLKRSFEHIDPALVGNDRHLLMSEIGGRSAIAERIRKIDPDVTRDHPAVKAVVEKLKTMEAAGWAFEGADASFELLVLRELGRHKPFFTILAYRVMSEHPTGQSLACSHAWVKILADGQDEIAAAEGNGPVHALDSALRRALRRFYPSLEEVRLTDYKVRVIDGGSATAAKVRVLIESSDGPHTWTTVGVSDDIIDASRAALVDSIEYKLINHL